MKQQIVTCKSDSEDIRIYIDGILHLRLPRDPNMKIQSWTEGHSKLYVIEFWCAGHLDCSAYDNKRLWTEILKIIDENL